ncbi:hypothetical protein BDK51DRAFT_51244 [Blyttiomyces helicus]|uniref:Uncharacterized protein n=1 Tax=Blyttiomyces helicus TaxID=388810 RepID=A0A4P9WE99_9FUNG|nr:hypothetical protein BDK51DRAFT_51244 [Blyttiomyces helicus]|eukprot:RKO91041.1 hypothetical protein BDK51DRAFT_51244 [Blyttiomyces helicus]
MAPATLPSVGPPFGTVSVGKKPESQWLVRLALTDLNPVPNSHTTVVCDRDSFRDLRAIQTLQYGTRLRWSTRMVSAARLFEGEEGRGYFGRKLLLGEGSLDSFISKHYEDELLMRFCDLMLPALDAQIVTWLLEDGVMEDFIGCIARPSAESPASSSPGNTPSVVDITSDLLRKRDRDIDATRRSYHVMEMICADNMFSQKLVHKAWDRIVTSLLRIFEPGSEGNFLFVHEPSIVDSIVTTLAAARKFSRMCVDKSDSAIHSLLEQSLQLVLLHVFAQRYLIALPLSPPAPDKPEVMEGAAELIMRIMHQPELNASQRDTSVILLTEAIENVISMIEGTDSPRHAKLWIAVVHALIVKKYCAISLPRRRSAARYLPQPKRLGPPVVMRTDDEKEPDLPEPVLRMLARRIDVLCRVLTSSATAPSSQPSGPDDQWTIARINILEIIFEITRLGGSEEQQFVPMDVDGVVVSDDAVWDPPPPEDDLSDVVCEIPWILLADWFFGRYRTSNIYGAKFAKLVVWVVRRNREEEMRWLFERDLEDGEGSDLLGSLAADSDPGSYAADLLARHQEWTELVPTLNAKTAAQLVQYGNFANGHMRPPAYFGPMVARSKRRRFDAVLEEGFGVGGRTSHHSSRSHLLFRPVLSSTDAVTLGFPAPFPTDTGPTPAQSSPASSPIARPTIASLDCFASPIRPPTSLATTPKPNSRLSVVLFASETTTHDPVPAPTSVQIEPEAPLPDVEGLVHDVNEVVSAPLPFKLDESPNDVTVPELVVSPLHIPTEDLSPAVDQPHVAPSAEQ